MQTEYQISDAICDASNFYCRCTFSPGVAPAVPVLDDTGTPGTVHVTTVVGPRKNYDPPALRHVLAPYTRPAGPLGIPYDHLLGRQGSALARAHVRNLIEALDALRFPGLLVLLVDHAELLDLEGASEEAADLGLVD